MTYAIDRAEALCRTHKVPTRRSDDSRGSDLRVLVERLEKKLKVQPHPKALMGTRLRNLEDGTVYRSPLLVYQGRYSTELCRAHPRVFFVFGDNLLRVGHGGQAIIRDEPNAVGVATKRSPGEFMSDSVADMGELCRDLIQIENNLERGEPHVIPITPEGRISLGCGLAELPYRAPVMYAFLESWLRRTALRYKPEKFNG